MARSGRRLVIGGAGPRLGGGTDEALPVIPRGEVGGYFPPSEADVSASESAIAQRTAAAEAAAAQAAAPVIIVAPPQNPPESGGDAGGEGTGGDGSGSGGDGGGGAGGGGDGGGDGGFARGGSVPGEGAEVIKAHAGEYVINRAAVKKYGAAVFDALNSGKAQIMNHDGYMKSYAKGGPVLGSGERFKKLESSLASKGAHDPAALAAYIGREKYGSKKFARLSAGGR